MARSQHGNPVVVHSSGASTTLQRLQPGGSGLYNEAYIQNLVFEDPESLPIDEIDCAYEDMATIRNELSTLVGSVDGLSITATGRTVLFEANLWRKPEVRRLDAARRNLLVVDLCAGVGSV